MKGNNDLVVGLVFTILIACFYFEAIRLFGLPLYDIALFICFCFLIKKAKYPKVLVPIFAFYIYYGALGIINGLYDELFRFVFCVLALYVGYSFVPYRGLFNRAKYIYLFLFLLSILFFYLDVLPKQPFENGPISSLGLYDKGRFSGFFNDPAKLAAFFYIPSVIYFGVYSYASIVLMVLAKTRFGILYLVTYLCVRNISQGVAICIGLAVSILIGIYYQDVVQFLMKMTISFRPEFENRQSIDGIRVLSAITLLDGVVDPGSIDVTGPGTKRLFSDPIPPHNSLLSTWLEVGLQGVLLLIFSLSVILRKAFVAGRVVQACFLLSPFLIFDFQNSRYMAFYIGYFIGNLRYQYLR